MVSAKVALFQVPVWIPFSITCNLPIGYLFQVDGKSSHMFDMLSREPGVLAPSALNHLETDSMIESNEDLVVLFVSVVNMSL